MADEFYPESDDSSQSTTSEALESQDPDEMEAETTLVPKSILGGKCKVGDRYIVEVVHEYEDEAEIKYVGKEGESEAEPDAEDSGGMEEAQGRLGAMAGNY